MSEEKLTPEGVALLEANLDGLTDEQKVKALHALRAYKKQAVKAHGAEHFLDFIQHVYPGYMIGEHHRRLAKIFEEIANGKKKRVIVNIAPRHGKSELI
jgi:hypothetical protein